MKRVLCLNINNGRKWPDQLKISQYQVFFHNNHLWHIGRQLTVVLLYILHQNSVFEAIWPEIP